MTLPESRGTDCWPDDHDYLDGRTEMFLPSQDGEEIRGYWDSDVLDLVGHSLRGQINVGEPFQVRFRAETGPGELWADATGDWTFDLAFSPIGSGSGFNLSNLLPSPSVLKVGSWRGADTRCIEVVATVPAGLLPESGGLYQVAAVIAFQPTGGKIAPISETQPLDSYSLRPSLSPSGPECWPDDHDYLDGRTEMFLPSQDGEEIRGYWDSDVLDPAGHSLRGQINVGEPFQVRFRAETRPGELWADATGDWTFDLAFSPIGSGSGFNLSNLLPSPSVLKVGSWRGADTRCIEVVATVPAGLLPESGGLYQVAAVIAFQPTGGKIAPISETQPLGSYSLQPQGGQRDQVEWVSDAPAPEDRLRREPLARTLATRLRRFVDEDPGTSFLIHIDGPWGAGKTTLLNLLRQELEHGSGQELEDGSAEEPKWLAITFNAWRQSRIGAAWWALLAALRHDLGDLHRLPGRAWLRVAESWARFRRAGAPFVLAFTLLLAAAAAVFALLRPHKLTFASSVGLAQGITAVVAAIGILWAGALVAGRFLLWDSARGARLFEQSNTNPMRDVAAHFGWLITKAKRPVVFFIDDLDRCTDSYVVELLDTIQTLVRDVTRHRPQRRRKVPATAAFVIAADGAWIRESYEITYAQFTALVAMPGRSLGYLFLDKLFQLHVPMPTIDPAMQQEYLRSILRVGDSQTATKDSKAEEQLVRKNLEQSSSEGEVIETLRKASPQVRRRVADAAVDKLTSRGVATATEHHLERFGSLLEPNPRAMKKFVNDYSILRAVRTLEGNSIGTDPLALWTIIEIRWPAMAGYLRTRPEAIKYMRGSNSMPEDVPADLHGLFNDPNIRELANFQYGGPLTPELIRACCGAAPPG